ncbi:hypothetical protein [Bifidobacterium biavatii]|uniref:hypothetical protein n=1 Tax=Bifidobacterium biavatii TaxID=762212 RepID=UPI001269F29A|nr:hypothetical protein [Bifidobacterium biavatii]
MSIAENARGNEWIRSAAKCAKPHVSNGFRASPAGYTRGQKPNQLARTVNPKIREQTTIDEIEANVSHPASPPEPDVRRNRRNPASTGSPEPDRPDQSTQPIQLIRLNRTATDIRTGKQERGTGDSYEQHHQQQRQ